MHDSASWRADAAKRVEAHRKGDWSITVRDASGTALPNASVSATLHRHAFGFGASARLERLFNPARDSGQQQEYRRILASNFHKLVAENAFKWKHIENNRAYIGPFLDWCAMIGTPVRGHTLVWPGFDRVPAEVRRIGADAVSLRRAVREHVSTVVEEYAGSLAEWDVLNEPFTENEFLGILGDDEAVEWFRLAAQADPAATRYINDFGVLTRSTPEHQDFYFAFIQSLLEKGAPVQGIGFQGHIPARFGPVAPTELLAVLDRFSVLGLEQQVTEFDFETEDQELQARYTADFLLAIFSHPSMIGLLTWTPFEYADGAVSKPSAAMYDKSLRIRPNGIAWNEMVNGQWSTRVELATDNRGAAGFRGFKGNYKIRVVAGGDTSLHYRNFDDKNSSADIKLG